MPRRVIPHDQFLAECKAAWGPEVRKWKFVCPACHTAQSAEDFLATGRFTPGSGQVNKLLGFSCIGRATGKGSAERRPEGEKVDPNGVGCDWTLGGLLQLHELEVDFGGELHPHFEIAPPPEAAAAAPAALEGAAA